MPWGFYADSLSVQISFVGVHNCHSALDFYRFLLDSDFVRRQLLEVVQRIRSSTSRSVSVLIYHDFSPSPFVIHPGTSHAEFCMELSRRVLGELMTE